MRVFHPLPAASCGDRKELASCQSMLLCEAYSGLDIICDVLSEVSSVNKSVYYNNTNYEKMQQYTRIIFIFRPPAGLFRIAAFPYNPPNSQKYSADLTW
jgi:hypothetical protein